MMNIAPASSPHSENGRLGKRWAVMALALVFALALSAFPALAKSDQGGYVGPGQGGGYVGPGPEFVTAKQARGMRDDTPVALKGYIIKSLGGEKYLFQDESGTITLDIDDKRWAGQTVGAEDMVEIHGKIDKDWADLEIEVKRLIKQ